MGKSNEEPRETGKKRSHHTSHVITEVAAYCVSFPLSPDYLLSRDA